MSQPSEPPNRSGLLRRAVGGARDAVDSTLDATVGRVGQSVGEAARGVTTTTAQQVIEDLEPYLVEVAVPRIVEGITPYLAQTVVPEVLTGVHQHLVEVTVPDVIDGVSAHLVEVTVPEVVAGVTPRLVDELLPRLLADLQPYLTEELVPEVVAGLTPLLEQQIAPQLIEALMPAIETDIAPRVVEGLMPMIQEQVAPQLVDSLLPRIEQEVAPRLVDSLLPKIRREVVPTILEDIVDDPRVRDLIREQSQGLLFDAVEALRENLADADDLAESLVRRIFGKRPRPADELALELVLADSAPSARLGRTWDSLAAQRRSWAASPMPPAPPGREHAHAGAVTRGLALIIDVTLVGWLVSQGLSALLSMLNSLVPNLPHWVLSLLTVVAATFVPVYLGLCWWLVGRTIGSFVLGTRVCTPDGRRPRFLRAMVRAWMGMLGLVVWLATAVLSVGDAKRRTLLDRVTVTEVRYVVPDDQQRRYLREALAARAQADTARP